MEALQIEVKQTHIKSGVCGDIAYCPIAKAARAAGHKRVKVMDHVMIVGNKDHRTYTTYELPQKARVFIDLFDEGSKVKPFKFTAHVQQ